MFDLFRLIFDFVSEFWIALVDVVEIEYGFASVLYAKVPFFDLEITLLEVFIELTYWFVILLFVLLVIKFFKFVYNFVGSWFFK